MSSADRPPVSDTDIAVIGMALRAPGARNIADFWRNLRDGVESVTWLEDAELRAAGVDEALIADPDYVKAAYLLPDMDRFDSGFFGFSPLEAKVLDPQHRQFYECAWEALENAAHVPAAFDGRIGVFAGCGMNTYYVHNLMTNPDMVRSVGLFLLRHTGNDKDFLATRVSYLFDLHGPSISVQTACSTSLVALHMACQSLLNGECDMALAGGSSIRQPHRIGYLYQEGEITAPDGHCRAFDADSAGTVFGSGVAVLAVRRLADALADGDHIYGVVKGSAVNNDGSHKIGYLAPSVDGQAESVAEALAMAGLRPDQISYIETHGTGTAVGDPIEVAALTQAFNTTERNFCGLGSVKTNIGHTDTAAGGIGVIKTLLSMQHRQIPPSLHYKAPNPEIDFANSPFYVNAELRAWDTRGEPRRAGVSSLGVGGTNAHVILEEAPPRPASRPSREAELLVLSAKTPDAADAAMERLADHLANGIGEELGDVAYTLQIGREAFPERRAVVCSDLQDAVDALRSQDPQRLIARTAGRTSPEIAFSFAGGGAQYPLMGAGLYETEEVYREAVDRSLELVAPRVDGDLRALLFPPAGSEAAAAAALERPSYALPALLTTQYAQARLWMSWGIRPAAMIGHSMGEYTAACLAGVLSLEDALGLVALRGRLFEQLPEGAMLSVPLSEGDLRPLLGNALSIAAVNAPDLCVASGPVAAIESLQRQLEERDIESQRIHISVAAHSAMLEPILAEFRDYVRTVSFGEPALPYVSNLSGTWITAQEARDPEYWVRHLRNTVRFADGVGALLETADRLFVEVGPGRTLTTLMRLHADKGPSHDFVNSMRHPDETVADQAFMLGTLGRLWAAGAEVDWRGFHGDEKRRRVPLPTYPFARERHWVEPGKAVAEAPQDAELVREPDPADWIYQFCWRERPLPTRDEPTLEGKQVLLLADDDPLTSALVATLSRQGAAVATVASGPGFAKTGDGAYRIRPGVREDYDELLRSLQADQLLPHSIVHLWNTRAAESEHPLQACDGAIETAFLSPMFLAQSWAEEAGEPVDVVLVSAGLQPAGGARVTHPERSLLFGPGLVVHKEMPEIRCRLVDLALHDIEVAAADTAGRVAAELGAADSDAFVAYRGATRLSQTYERLRVEPRAQGNRGFRQGGVYLITGGLGGIGLTIAEHLARKYAAKLVLIGRRGLPPREEWSARLEANGNGDATSKAIRKIADLEAAGAEVLVLPADVTDLSRMQQVVAEAKQRFGAIHGVLHSAGVLQDGLFLEKTRAEVERVLGPKVRGTLVLQQALADEPLDTMLLFSSRSAVSGIAGQIDYTAANAFLNAFAYGDRVGTTGAMAIGWGAWRDVGMAAALAAGSAPEAEGVPVPTHHPLLDRGFGNGGSGSQVFVTEVSTARHWIVDEHRIRGGEALIPGAGYLEFIRAAARSESAGPIEIRDLMFLAPFVVHDGSSRHLRIGLQADNGVKQVVIEGRASSSAPWQEHVRGAVATMDEIEPRPQMSLEQLRARCPQVVTFEDKVERDHLSVGPRWQSLRAIHLGERELLVELALPEEFATDLDDFELHPALLDVATASGQRIIPGFDPANDFYVPASYAAFRMYAPLERELVSHIRLRDDAGEAAEIASFDVTVMSTGGEVLAEAEEFVLYRVADRQVMNQETDTTEEAASGVPGGLDLTEAIRPTEGIEVLERLVANPVPSAVIVSPHDLNGWLAEIAKPPEPVATAAAEDPGIDVGPVEEALAAHEAIAEAALSVHGRAGNHRIIAHVVYDLSHDVTVSELRRFLRASFDEELIPNHFVEIDALPRTARGDLDRSALEDPFARAVEVVAPRTETERKIADIWKELLGTEQVGVHDNFLDVGGHSLLAIRAVSRIKKETGVRVTASAMNLQTLEQIAAACDKEIGSGTTAAAS